MKRIDSYVVRQFFSLLGVSLLGFIVIFLVVDAVENMDKFIDAEVPKGVIAAYYFHSIPWFVSIGLPMAVLVSTIFTVGLLSRRNELTAMKASGVSLYRIAMPLILCSILISGASFFFEDRVVTAGNQKRRAIEKDYLIKESGYFLEKVRRLSHCHRSVYAKDSEGGGRGDSFHG